MKQRKQRKTIRTEECSRNNRRKLSFALINVEEAEGRQIECNSEMHKPRQVEDCALMIYQRHNVPQIA